jgi:tetratricopeptide (TPR) repeat protein
MREIPARVAAVVAMAGLAAAGCDQLPSPPKTADGEVPSVLAVEAGDEAELAAVVAAEKARVNYDYRLEVLKAYFLQVGQLDRYRWATRELENLRNVRMPKWVNVPPILPPPGESLSGADERVLVELAVAARKDYLEAVDKLAEHYERRDADSYKARRIHNVQARFDPVRTYMYFLEAEIPPADLKPAAVVPEADDMYDAAIQLYREGSLVPAVPNRSKLRRALMMLLQLVRKHPDSTKIALAAYYIADIYKEYFGEYVRAVHWYERAWQWDPNITKPARFDAAIVYDVRLHNAAKAVELYRESIKFDPWRLGNPETAKRRIRELTEEG